MWVRYWLLLIWVIFILDSLQRKGRGCKIGIVLYILTWGEITFKFSNERTGFPLHKGPPTHLLGRRWRERGQGVGLYRSDNQNYDHWHHQIGTTGRLRQHRPSDTHNNECTPNHWYHVEKFFEQFLAGCSETSKICKQSIISQNITEVWFGHGWLVEQSTNAVYHRCYQLS